MFGWSPLNVSIKPLIASIVYIV